MSDAQSELKDQILGAFGVTEAEVDDLDRAMHGPEIRRAREADERLFRETVLGI